MLTEQNKRYLAGSGWKEECPAEQGWYWHWNGDPEALPLPTSVLYSGTARECFVSAGQLGITQAVMCSAYGGWWRRIIEPRTL